MVEETFRNTIKRYNLLERKDRLMLGTSGGPDSIFMLYQFYSLAKEYKLQLVCAHFNHMLRPEADSEEEFVKNICKGLGIKFVAERKDVNKFFKGDSLEQTARNLRFDFFLNSSRHFKIKKLALAHHKDDLVETVLMRIIRGTGLKGLRAFLPKSKFRSLTIIRPLIELHKKDILKWLESKNISYCVDKSNLEDKFLRNRIRLKLMPQLCEINPSIAQNLYNLSINTALDYDFIYTFSRKEFEKLKRGETKREIKLDLEGLKKNHPAILNNIMRIAIEELKGDTRRLELRHLDEIKDLIENRPSGSIVHLPELSIRKEERRLVIQALIL
ncbi:MAG: tRNA lysidine(34) synthetase TilS [Candidatus Omnitrophica bacterium]|nr:tRNA lysidine(34) synthetase TilS [Candidatus Omnitrophota bacterium]